MPKVPAVRQLPIIQCEVPPTPFGQHEARSRFGSGWPRHQLQLRTASRGKTVCPNGRMAAIPVADGAVHELLAATILKPQIVDRRLIGRSRSSRPRPTPAAGKWIWHGRSRRSSARSRT
jgi:hypothetical protein